MTSANLPNDAKGDKQQVPTYMTDDERKVVGLAAVLEDVSRSAFVGAAAVEKAVEILTDRNPSALNDTPWDTRKTA